MILIRFNVAPNISPVDFHDELKKIVKAPEYTIEIYSTYTVWDADCEPLPTEYILSISKEFKESINDVLSGLNELSFVIKIQPIERN